MERPKDYLQQLADYVKRNLSKGYTLESLRFSLINQGYSRISVDNAIELANKQLAAKVPPMKEKPQITYRLTPEIPFEENLFKKLLRKLLNTYL